MADYIMITTTTDSREEAERLAALMVDERLCACAQVEGPINSFYRWQGKVENDVEWRCLFKTKTSLFPEFESILKENHSYDVPQLVAVTITNGSADYLEWLDNETR